MEIRELSYHFTLGFPQWQVAMVRQDGTIKAFPMDGSEYSSFPKLPKKKYGNFYAGLRESFLDSYMILNSRSYILNKLILSLSIDKSFTMAKTELLYPKNGGGGTEPC